MEYFAFWYRLSAEYKYLIWISDDQDKFLFDEKNLIPSFANLSDLQAYAAAHKIGVNVEALVLHDLDQIISWLGCPTGPLNCTEFLNAWNAFSDIAISCQQIQTDFRKLDRENKAIYDKFFRGCNLPAVTPKDERYEPEWNPQEIESIASIMTFGLDFFVSRISAYN